VRNPRGRARCRGHDVEVLDYRSDGSSQVRFISGIMKGTTISVISDEVEYPVEIVAEGLLIPEDAGPIEVASDVLIGMAQQPDDVVCQCSDAEKQGTMTVPDDELGMYVCGVCGKPSRLALAKAAAQGGLVW
jgi:hypothetical protein